MVILYESNFYKCIQSNIVRHHEPQTLHDICRSRSATKQLLSGLDSAACLSCVHETTTVLIRPRVDLVNTLDIASMLCLLLPLSPPSDTSTATDSSASSSQRRCTMGMIQRRVAQNASVHRDKASYVGSATGVIQNVELL